MSGLLAGFACLSYLLMFSFLSLFDYFTAFNFIRPDKPQVQTAEYLHLQQAE
jgi:hypothetical protein